MSKFQKRVLIFGPVFVVVAVLATIILLNLPLSMRPGVTEEDLARDAPRQRAEAFIQSAALGDVPGACLSVINSGSNMNDCMDDLGSRDDFKRLAGLSDGSKVGSVQIDGETATVSAGDISPKPPEEVSFKVIIDPSESGGWRVRELNGQPIKWKAMSKR